MKLRTYLTPLILIAPALYSQVASQTPASRSADTARAFPREINNRGFHIVVYQPQIDSWKMNRLEARAALTVSGGDTKQEMFGIVTLTARTEVDKETRTVWLEDPRISKASFPGAESQQHGLERAVRDSLPDWPKTIALDRLVADLSINSAEAQTEAAPLKNDPPRIIFSQVPSVLIVIDGDPVMKPVAGNAKYTRVINTPALLLFDTSASQYYLDGNTFWMKANNLNGPWSRASAVPADLDALRTQILGTEEKDPHDHSNDASAPTSPPSAVWAVLC